MDELVMSMILMFSSPLIAFGAFHIGMIVQEMIAVKYQHNIKMNLITRNHRKRSAFVKPEGGYVKLGDKTFDYDDSSGMVILEGSTPSTYYNEKTMKQIDMTAKGSDLPVDPNHFSDLLIRSFNLGVLSSQKEDNKIMGYVAIAALCAGLGLIVAAMTFLSLGSTAGIVEQIAGSLGIVIA